MNAVLTRFTSALARLRPGRSAARMRVEPGGPCGELRVPSAGDGCWQVLDVRGRACLTPDERSYYLYFVAPDEFLARATSGVWVEVEYVGERYGGFRLQYASRDATRPDAGLYHSAEQFWTATRPASNACVAPCSRCPTSTPRARRTRAPRSGSSSAATCASRA